jgi:WD40 repeat protein
MPKIHLSEETLELSKVIGLSTFHGSAITSSPNIEGVIYTAGSVAVHYSSKQNAQVGFYAATKAISSIAISADGRFLALGERGHQPSIVIWNLLKQEKVTVLNEHKYGIGCLAFSPNGKYLVSVGFKPDKQLILWEWEHARKLSSQKIGNKVFAINFHKSGDYFVTAGDRHLKWWYLTEVLDGEAVGLEGKPASIAEAQRNAVFVDVIVGYGGTEGTTFCTTSQGVLSTFNEERAVDKWVQLESPVSYCLELFSMTGAAGLLLVGCANGVIRAFLPSTLEYITTLPLPMALTPAAISEKELLDMSLSNFEDLQHEKEKEEQEKGKYAACWALRQVYGSTNDPIPKICTIYADRAMIVWDISDLFAVKLFRSFLSHRTCVWDVQFIERFSLFNSNHNKSMMLQQELPPGTFVTCSADNTVRFWNALGNTITTTNAGGVEKKKKNSLAELDQTVSSSLTHQERKADYFHHYSTEMMNCIEINNNQESEVHPHPHNQLGLQDPSVLDDTMTISTASLLHGKSPSSATAGGANDFDYSQGKPDLEIPDRPQSSFAPRTIAIHPFGHQIVCGDKTGKLRIYDLKTMALVYAIQAHSAEILTLSFSPPLVTYDQGRTWIVYTGEDEEMNQNNEGEDDEEHHQQHHQNVQREDLLVLLATSGRDRLIHVFNANNHGSANLYSPLDTLDHHSSSVTVVRFTQDGKRLISCGGDKTIVFHAVNGPHITKLKTVQTPSGTINGLSVEVSNKFAVSSSQDKKIVIWNVNDGKLMRTYKNPAELNSELYKNDIDPSGSYIVTCSFDKQITVLDFFSGEVVCQLAGHSELITGLKFSPDGSTLVSVGGDGCIMIWKTSYSLMRSMKDRLVELFSKAQKRNSKALTRQQQSTNSLYSSAAATAVSSIYPPAPPPTGQQSNAVQTSLSNLKMKINNKSQSNMDQTNQTNISAMTTDSSFSASLASQPPQPQPHQLHHFPPQQLKKNRWQENLQKDGKAGYEIAGKKILVSGENEDQVVTPVVNAISHNKDNNRNLPLHHPANRNKFTVELSSSPLEGNTPKSMTATESSLPLPPPPTYITDTSSSVSAGNNNNLDSTSKLAATVEARDGVNLPDISSDEEEDSAEKLFKSLDEYESDFEQQLISPSKSAELKAKSDGTLRISSAESSLSPDKRKMKKEEDDDLAATQTNLDNLEKSASDLESWLEQMVRTKLFPF